MLTRPPEMAWDLTLETTDRIVARLAAFGLEITADSFRLSARSAGNPSTLAGSWLENVETSGTIAAQPAGGDDPGVESLLSAAAFELWKRWIPDMSCADILAEEFDRHYEPLDVLMFGHPGAVRDALARAHRIVDVVQPSGPPGDPDLFENIWARTYHDLALWLRCLPQVLAHRELYDEAIRLCERLADVFDARSFLTDRALLLAQMGRREEARAQISANVKRWRRDPTVLRKSCEALWALGHAGDALLLYDEVLETMSRTDHPEDASGTRPLPDKKVRSATPAAAAPPATRTIP